MNRLLAGLKAEIQSRHNEVIGFNEQLKEQAIRQAQEDINRLNNQLFSIQNKTENLHGLQEAAVRRIRRISKSACSKRRNPLQERGMKPPA